MLCKNGVYIFFYFNIYYYLLLINIPIHFFIQFKDDEWTHAVLYILKVLKSQCKVEDYMLFCLPPTIS